jgi:hypothetical protein
VNAALGTHIDRQQRGRRPALEEPADHEPNHGETSEAVNEAQDRISCSCIAVGRALASDQTECRIAMECSLSDCYSSVEISVSVQPHCVAPS